MDVVPFVPLGSATIADAIDARDRFAAWAGEELALPCFLYGPERSLPELRRLACARHARSRYRTDDSRIRPPARSPSARDRCSWPTTSGWPNRTSRSREQLATELRGPVGAHAGVRGRRPGPALGEPRVAPRVGPADLFDAVAGAGRVARAELVGLVPRAVLEQIPSRRWPELDLDDSSTIEARMASAGLVVEDDVP